MFGHNQVMVPKSFDGEPKNTLKIVSIFYTLQGEGKNSGTPCVFIRLMGCNLQCSFCFTEETYITLSNGDTKRIKDINIGDIVLSYNEAAKTFEPKKVIKLYKSMTNEIVEINEITQVTKEHPFLTENRGWVNANELVKGDKLLSTKEPILVRKVVNSIKITQPLLVYNFEVEDNHTYVANNLVVHNCDTFFDAGDRLTYDEIFDKVYQQILNFYASHNLNVPQSILKNTLLVITGGEPLNQPNLTNFLYEAHKKGFRTQIESNGLIERELPLETEYLISPKINEKTKSFIKLNPTMFARANYLKFVISNTMEGYTDLPEFAINWHQKSENNGKLYVSPMNMYLTQPVKLGANGTLEGRSEIDERISFWTPGLLDMKQNQENHEHAAFIALKYGCKLSLQTHLLASLP